MLPESKSFLDEKGIKPRISFKDGLPHTVTLLKEERATIEIDGKEKDGIKYTVDEDGIEKDFFSSSISLIGRMAQISVGEKIVIQMSSSKDSNGEYKSGYSVRRYIKNAGKNVQEFDDDNIPIIEE